MTRNKRQRDRERKYYHAFKHVQHRIDPYSKHTVPMSASRCTPSYSMRAHDLSNACHVDIYSIRLSTATSSSCRNTDRNRECRLAPAASLLLSPNRRPSQSSLSDDRCSLLRIHPHLDTSIPRFHFPVIPGYINKQEPSLVGSA